MGHYFLDIQYIGLSEIIKKLQLSSLVLCRRPNQKKVFYITFYINFTIIYITIIICCILLPFFCNFHFFLQYYGIKCSLTKSPKCIVLHIRFVLQISRTDNCNVKTFKEVNFLFPIVTGQICNERCSITICPRSLVHLYIVSIQ